MQIAVAPANNMGDYLDAVRGAEAEPIVIDWKTQSAADIARDAAGILLLGGADVAPGLYGEAPHPTFEVSEPARDAYEIALIRLAIERDVPLFAICRGAQVLNVALGGSLIQDIPSQVPGAIRHVKLPGEEKFTVAHEVHVAAGSRLHALLGARLSADDRCGVNSRHHQAVKAVGRDLAVSATAPDGIIEAIERPASAFCLGVQWHPENFWRTGEFAALFRAFVAAAAVRRGP